METAFAIVNDKVRRNAVNAILDLPLEQYLVVIKRRGKTNEQRSYWHKCLDVMCKETGYELIELKTIIKRQVFGVKTFTTRKGEVMERDVSSEELSTKDYSLLIDRTILLAQTAGIALPHPADYGLER